MNWHYRVIGSGGLIVHSSLMNRGFKGYESYDKANEVAREFAKGNALCQRGGCTIEIFTKTRFRP